jgi:hypothetical protein
MKINPYAYILCAAAFLGLPLVSVSAPAVDEEEIPPSALKKYDANKDGTLDATEKAAWQADKEALRDCFILLPGVLLLPTQTSLRVAGQVKPTSESVVP